jgi:hypothetical protein
LSFFDIVITLALAIVAFTAFSQIRGLNKEIDFVRRRSLDHTSDLAEEILKLQDEVRKLRVQSRMGGGTLKFTPDVRIDELSAIHPAATDVLASFHIGGCSDCAVDDSDTLAGAAREKGVELETLLTALNGLLEPDGKTAKDLERIGTSGLLQIQTSR